MANKGFVCFAVIVDSSIGGEAQLGLPARKRR